MRIHSHPTLKEKDKFSTSPAQQDKNKGADELLCFSLCFLYKHPVEFGEIGLFWGFLGGWCCFSFFTIIPFYSLTSKKLQDLCSCGTTDTSIWAEGVSGVWEQSVGNKNIVPANKHYMQRTVIMTLSQFCSF